MVDEEYKKKTANIVKKAKEKGLVKSYTKFCDSDEAKEYALSEEEVIYYTSEHKEEVNEKITYIKTVL